MSAGLFGLLDDVAAIARLAAASVDDVAAGAGRASVKAAGVVVDDTAVTPQYVHGIAAERELPIIWKIAKGSLRNKLLFILPAAMLLSQFLPWAVMPLLMLGACFLCFEGAEKVWHAWRHRGDHDLELPSSEVSSSAEDEMVGNAVRTDFILSAEIMVISLNEVADESFLSRLLILIVVAIAITAVVYGVVGLIVKMDDAGLLLTQRKSNGAQRAGRLLVHAMPTLLSVLSVVGTAAMLWVGGHILLLGMHDLGFDPLYDLVHHLEDDVHHAVPVVGGVLGWLVNTAASAVLGILVGALIVVVLHLLPFGPSREKHELDEPMPHVDAHGGTPDQALPDDTQMS